MHPIAFSISLGVFLPTKESKKSSIYGLDDNTVISYNFTVLVFIHSRLCSVSCSVQWTEGYLISSCHFLQILVICCYIMVLSRFLFYNNLNVAQNGMCCQGRIVLDVQLRHCTYRKYMQLFVLVRK